MPVKKEVFDEARRGHEARARCSIQHLGASTSTIMANATKRPQDVAGTHFFAPANVMKLFEVVEGAEELRRTLVDGDEARPRRSARSAPGRQLRWLRRQPQPQPRSAPRWTSWSRRAPARAGRQGHGRFRLSRSGRSRSATCRGSTSATTRAKRRAAADPELPRPADRRPAGRDGTVWARRPAPAGIATRRATARRIVDPEVARRHQGGGRRDGHPQQRTFTDEEILHRLLFSSVNEACKILEEGKALSRQRHRRDVAARLRLPALSRRPDVLGRRHRRARGLQPDRGLASALRRALATVGGCCANWPSAAAHSAS